jgi:hypothetical protein
MCWLALCSFSAVFTEIGRGDEARSLARSSTSEGEPAVGALLFGSTSDTSSFLAPLDTAVIEDSTPQFLPVGLLFQPYLAGEKEPRFALQTLYETGRGWIWEASLGSRIGILRFGEPGPFSRKGWQIDLEGAAMPRLDLQQQEDVDAIDFRFGVPLTYRNESFSWKVGYYHISSHLGDELILREPTIPRINYVRESVVFAVSQDLSDSTRIYGEIGYAFSRNGGARPLELQFGMEYGAQRPLENRIDSPFAALNVHLREDFDMGGSVNMVAGWQWRGLQTNHLFRVGVQYYRGRSLQYEFFDRHEELVGFGTWLDF